MLIKFERKEIEIYSFHHSKEEMMGRMPKEKSRLFLTVSRTSFRGRNLKKLASFQKKIFFFSLV
jgi:hypothetical protein